MTPMKPTKGDLEKGLRLTEFWYGKRVEIPWKETLASLIAQALAEARAEAVKEFLESKEFKNIAVLIRYYGCICPNHQRFNKHACPCTLRHLEISDAFTDLEKLKHSLTGEGQ